MRVGVLFSGGKDSTYATWIVQQQGWEVAALVTVRPHSQDSQVFHSPNVEWTHLQAEALGLGHQVIESKEDDDLADLQHALSNMKRERKLLGVVTGAVASDYQKTRFDNLCDSTGLKSYSPLWHKNPRVLIEDLKKAGMRIVLTAVAAKGLDASWLGKELSDSDWSRLETLSKNHGFHLAGEGGEYESLVLDAPFFRKTIIIERSRVEWKGDAGRLVIEKSSSREKLRN